jgi:hypothetical protein
MPGMGQQPSPGCWSFGPRRGCRSFGSRDDCGSLRCLIDGGFFAEGTALMAGGSRDKRIRITRQEKSAA